MRSGALRSAVAHARLHYPRHAGFTLMEVVIVMVIIGILTAIAIPSYTAYIQRSNRSEARGQLLMVAQWMERFRNENSRYDDPANPNNPPAIPVLLQCSPSNLTGVGTCRNYTIAVAAATAGTYALTATPVGGSPMAGDACGNLTLDSVGIRGRTGTAAMALCWDR